MLFNGIVLFAKLHDAICNENEMWNRETNNVSSNIQYMYLVCFCVADILFIHILDVFELFFKTKMFIS